MKKYKVVWHDGQDDCSHCSVFESDHSDPRTAAGDYLRNLGELWKYGYLIESTEEAGDSEPIGHPF